MKVDVGLKDSRRSVFELKVVLWYLLVESSATLSLTVVGKIGNTPTGLNYGAFRYNSQRANWALVASHRFRKEETLHSVMGTYRGKHITFL